MATVVCMLSASVAPAAPLLGKFLRPDGAVVVASQGDSVDPYFSNKALIIALEAGLDAVEPTRAWLAWLVPRQRDDGGFDRFCADGSGWRSCQRADADDSSVATFLHLSALYTQAVRRARVDPLAIKAIDDIAVLANAERKASALLERLRTPRGTYRAFADEPIEYLMDNTEVYASLVATGRSVQASQLKKAIYKHFFVGGEWLPANAAYKQFDFYPSALAPAYLWHTGLVSPTILDQAFSAWAHKWGKQWLTLKHDAYAWGLVAWGARHATQQHWIRCWRSRYQDHERMQGWTVLDEAIDLGLAHLGVQAVAQSCESVLDKE
jgi:hypothetical protein